MLILTTCMRKLGFLIAAKSMTRLLVGYFARQLGAIPVQRGQDSAVAGKGTVMIRGVRVLGSGTTFLSDFGESGAAFSCPGESDGLRVVKVVSDEELELASVPSRGDVDSVKYKIIPKLDQHKVYEAVWTRLSEGGCIGIFPEGGSHDRSDLLPLKAGVSIMALGAMAHHKGLQVQIVPCGLNYWAGHRFRSTVVVEFGRPYRIPLHLAELYDQGQKREACGELLNTTEQLMRSVTFNMNDFTVRRMITTIRHLYVPSHYPIPVDRYMDLTRQLAKGYEQRQNEPEVVALKDRVIEYSENLSMLGVTDDHVAADDSLNSTLGFLYMVLLRLFALIAILVFAAPGLIFNAPIAIIAKIVAAQQAKKAKAGSVVKIAGTDVVASYKVIIGIVVTPILYTTYAVIVFLKLGFLSFLLFTILWPLFSWASVRVLEEGVRIWKSFLFLFRLRLWATNLKTLRETRKQLQIQAREFGVQVAPDFAPENLSHIEPQTRLGSFSKKKGYMSKHEEINRLGIRLNESYEDLEKALMDADEHI